MELAALVSFAILFVAWLVAPDGPRALDAVERSALEPEPVRIQAAHDVAETVGATAM